MPGHPVRRNAAGQDLRPTSGTPQAPKPRSETEMKITKAGPTGQPTNPVNDQGQCCAFATGEGGIGRLGRSDSPPTRRVSAAVTDSTPRLSHGRRLVGAALTEVVDEPVAGQPGGLLERSGLFE